ncbi:MAG: hypothetical protein WCW53_04890 [Syntrophales bacterium]
MPRTGTTDGKSPLTPPYMGTTNGHTGTTNGHTGTTNDKDPLTPPFSKGGLGGFLHDGEGLVRDITSSANGDGAKGAGINAVFVPEDAETISFFKARGFKVFISVNAFGGRGAWEKYPDARPVRADGHFLGEDNDGEGGHGGVCPTHGAWRVERLTHIKSLVARFGKSGGIDGIWLDFVRYPGFWETANPHIPDTCYCPRCLEKFGKDKGIRMPAGLAAKDAAMWIRKNHPYEWMVWKKEQINSFVREVRDVLAASGPHRSPSLKTHPHPNPPLEGEGMVSPDSALEGKELKERLLLGVFVVPWTKGEKDNAVSFRLAQDTLQLAEIVDVISPMVYHQMVDRTEDWVGKMTAYYKETARCAVWPIVQAVDTTAESFGKVVRQVQDGGADGILAYKWVEGKGKIPLNPPLGKGEDKIPPTPPLAKGGMKDLRNCPPLVKEDNTPSAPLVKGDNVLSPLLVKGDNVLSPLLVKGDNVLSPLLAKGDNVLSPLLVKGDNVLSPLLVKGGRGDFDGEVSQWRALADFQPLVNLIPNPEFSVAPGDKLPWGWKTVLQDWGSETRDWNKRPQNRGAEAQGSNNGQQGGKTTAPKGGKAEPQDWKDGPPVDFLPKYDMRSSHDLVTGGEKGSSPSSPASPLPTFSCLGIGGSRLGEGQWHTALPPCEPGQEYLFTGLFYQHLSNTPSYPVVRIWGQRAVLDSYWMADKFQPLRTYVRCPDKIEDSTFRLINELPPRQVWMGKPSLVKRVSTTVSGRHDGFFYPNSFPIGVYGATVDKLEEIKRLALNTVIIGGGGASLKKTIRECRRLGLRYVLSVPHDPERLKVYLDNLRESSASSTAVQTKAHPHPNPPLEGEGISVETSFIEGDGAEVGFYVDDEPELRSAPINKAEDVQALIKGRFPRASTCMAVVRPPRCRDYLGASDYFMMDQYPFPGLPMTWLSDSMDEAAAVTGRNRLLSVIQAFHEGEVWPDLPGWKQIDCLAFLSVVHGSRGIFFFTYGDIGKTEEGRRRLGRVVGRLNTIYPWLLEKNIEEPVGVEMLSEYRVDPKGRPAVHAAVKKKGGATMMIAVNTIGAPVKAALTFAGLKDGAAKEVFSGLVYPVVNGRLTADFLAHQALAFVIQ